LPDQNGRLDLSQSVRILLPALLGEWPLVRVQDDETMNTLRDDQLLTIVKNVVEQNGCRLVDIDFDHRILNIEGSEEAQARCALALEKVLG